MQNDPTGLHFSGHGVENVPNQVGLQNYHLKNQGNCLVFETEDCSAHFITEIMIRD